MIVDQSHHGRKAFSLIELLMSIMILAIGLISVAALFPAGIVQQQRAKDNIDGPSVARSAMELIRSRISQEDFGDWTEFYSPDEVSDLIADGDLEESPSYYLADGDWPWLRPALVDPDNYPDAAYRGAVDVFNWLGARNSDYTITDLETDSGYYEYCFSRNLNAQSDGYLDPLGIPFSRRDLRTDPPQVIFTMSDRTWPPTGSEKQVPQYFWDFMLARRGGAVYAAVFVYRIAGGVENARSWAVEPARIGAGRSQIPVPAASELAELWNVGDGNGFNRPLPGTEGDFDPLDASASWQYPDQWIVDNIGTIHHVERGRNRPNQAFSDGKGVLLFENVPSSFVGGKLVGFDGSVEVLPRSFSVPLPDAAIDAFGQSPQLHGGGFPDASVPVVDRLWFVPRTINTSSSGISKQWELVPIYVMVERL
ncbi:MAG: hypothetical protein CMJ40_07200 [Phycisphaerae bacterium]|nr:hypothetical protein [Phycisphaerae bacterium]